MSNIPKTVRSYVIKEGPETASLVWLLVVADAIIAESDSVTGTFDFSGKHAKNMWLFIHSCYILNRENTSEPVGRNTANVTLTFETGNPNPTHLQVNVWVDILLFYKVLPVLKRSILWVLSNAARTVGNKIKAANCEQEDRRIILDFFVACLDYDITGYFNGGFTEGDDFSQALNHVKTQIIKSIENPNSNLFVLSSDFWRARTNDADYFFYVQPLPTPPLE